MSPHNRIFPCIILCLCEHFTLHFTLFSSNVRNLTPFWEFFVHNFTTFCRCFTLSTLSYPNPKINIILRVFYYDSIYQNSVLNFVALASNELPLFVPLLRLRRLCVHFENSNLLTSSYRNRGGQKIAVGKICTHYYAMHYTVFCSNLS